MSFANYKKNKVDLASLSTKVDQLSEKKSSSFKDDRFWKATVDKVGNGSATIRFLPAADGEDLPWQQYHEHNFEVDGNYFIELCPTTKDGRKCPVCAANKVLWNTEIESNKKIVRDRKRKLHYVSNILVLKDKENPDNEGKVFLYRYGQKIYEKIKLQLKPKDPDDAPVNVFDLFDGADFRLEIKNVKVGEGSYRNYDDSSFRVSAPLFKGDEAQMEKVYNQLYKLEPFVEDAKFKSYEDLEKKLQETLSGPRANVKKKADELFPEGAPESKEPAAPKKTRKPKPAESEETPPWEEAVQKPASTKAPAKPRAAKKDEPEPEPEIETESGDDMDYYKQFVEED